MGAIRKAIDDFSGDTEQAETQRQLVETLAELAEAKGKQFEYEIKENLRTAGKDENMTVPIQSIIESTNYTHSYTSKDASSIGKTVDNTLKDFVRGGKDNIMNAVGSLITESLTDFLGSSSAADSTLSKYYVMTQNIAIVRVDIMVWQLNVQAKSIYRTVEKVCAVSAVRSSIDIAKIGFSTFAAIYENQLAPALSREDVQEELAYAHQIYKQFHEDMPHPLVPAQG